MNVISLVFCNRAYAGMAVIFFVGLLLPLLVLAEFVFFEPFLVSHLPSGSEAGLALILAVCCLAAMVLPMNIYRIRRLSGSRRKMGGGIMGSMVGAAAGACSCGPLGFAVISTFGSAGGVATAFLTNYEIPVRLASVAILGIAMYTTHRSISAECRINERDGKLRKR